MLNWYSLVPRLSVCNTWTAWDEANTYTTELDTNSIKMIPLEVVHLSTFYTYTCGVHESKPNNYYWHKTIELHFKYYSYAHIIAETCAACYDLGVYFTLAYPTTAITPSAHYGLLAISNC